MVPLILEERLTDLLLVVDVTRLRVELRVVSRVSVSLNILTLSCWPASVYGSCLTRRPM